MRKGVSSFLEDDRTIAAQFSDDQDDLKMSCRLSWKQEMGARKGNTGINMEIRREEEWNGSVEYKFSVQGDGLEVPDWKDFQT